MSLDNFLNPEGENEEAEMEVQQQEEVDIDELIQHHTRQAIQEEEEEDIDVVMEVEEPVPTSYEALAAIKLLQNYEIRQKNSTPAEIRFLERLERSISLVIEDSLQQSTLDRWLT